MPVSPHRYLTRLVAALVAAACLTTFPSCDTHLTRVPEDVTVGPGWFWGQGRIFVWADGAVLEHVVTAGPVDVSADHATVDGVDAPRVHVFAGHSNVTVSDSHLGRIDGGNQILDNRIRREWGPWLVNVDRADPHNEVHGNRWDDGQPIEAQS